MENVETHDFHNLREMGNWLGFLHPHEIYEFAQTEGFWKRHPVTGDDDLDNAAIADFLFRFTGEAYRVSASVSTGIFLEKLP
jgi:hypothetical protein